MLPSVVVVRDKNLNGCEHLLINNGIACRRFSFAVSPQNPRKSLRRIAFHPYYRRKLIPPAGVAGLKTRRKVYWATVGNKRRNVVLLVIDNKFEILA